MILVQLMMNRLTWACFDGQNRRVQHRFYKLYTRLRSLKTLHSIKTNFELARYKLHTGFVLFL